MTAPLRGVVEGDGATAAGDAEAVDGTRVRATPAASLAGDGVLEGDGGASVAGSTAAAVGVLIADAVGGVGVRVMVIGVRSLTEVDGGSGVRVGGGEGAGVAVGGGQMSPGWPGTAPLVNPPGPQTQPSMSPSCMARAAAPTGEYCHAVPDQR